MNYAFYENDFGYFKIGYEDNYLLLLDIIKHVDNKNVQSNFSKNVSKQLQEYLDKKRQKFDLNYKINGNDNFIKIINEISKISYGCTKTYKQVAQDCGLVKAYRHIGYVCSKNPIIIVVPCHRVVGSNNIGGYSAGINIKQFLINLEK